MKSSAYRLAMVLVLAGLCACGKPGGGEVAVVADASEPKPNTAEFLPPAPVHHLTELLKNASFEEEVGGAARGWTVAPANPEWKTDAGKEGAAGFMLKPPNSGKAVVEQTVALHPSVAGLTLQAQAEVRCADAGAVVVEVEFPCGEEKKIVSRENAGSDQWQTVSLRTPLPAGVDLSSVKYRVAAYGNTRIAVIDSASLMMIKDEPNLVETEFVANGSFERTVDNRAENWEVLPAATGAIDQAEPSAGKNLFKLSPPATKGYGTLQQALNLGMNTRGRKLNVQVKVKGAEPKKATLALIRRVGKEDKALASAENSGAEGWETLAITATIPSAETPAEAQQESFLLRVALRPGAANALMVDEASARVAE